MKKTALILVLTIAAAALLFVGIYIWFGCRFYVKPGYLAVVTAKTGREPAPGAILVEAGEKGIRREVLGEGRHFLDPVYYDVEIFPCVNIPLGKVGVYTSKVGKELPPGEIIAAAPDSKGVRPGVLGPGTYRINPMGGNVKIYDAVNIPIGYVGVVTSQYGKPAAPGKFAAEGEKGVRRDILHPGLYYINPVACQVNIIEIGMNQVSMTGKAGDSLIQSRNLVTNANFSTDKISDIQEKTLRQQQEMRLKYAQNTQNASSSFGRVSAPSAPRAEKKAPASALRKSRRAVAREDADAAMEAQAKANSAKVNIQAENLQSVIYGVSRMVEFPSRDGFKIQIEMTVEFELMPGSIAGIYLLHGDLPQVVEKIILPQVMSVSRLKGSSYKAQDFIMGEARELFQNELKKELKKAMADKNIIVHNAIVRSVEVPSEILDPIQNSSVSREQSLTNKSRENAARSTAELNNWELAVKQRELETRQETKKLVAEITADEMKTVAVIDAETELEVEKLKLKKAQVEASAYRLLGESEVSADFLTGAAEARGIALKSGVLNRNSPGVMSDLALIENLNDKIESRVIYAGPGTLWTDLRSAALTPQQERSAGGKR